MIRSLLISTKAMALGCRVVCCAVVMLFTGSAFAVPVFIDHFEDPESMTTLGDPPATIPAEESTTVTDDPLASAWGAKRQLTLSRPSPVTDSSPTVIINGSGLESMLDFSQTSGESTLEIRYGADAVSSSTTSVNVDIEIIDASGTGNYPIQLTIASFPGVPVDPFDYGSATTVTDTLNTTSTGILNFDLTSGPLAAITSSFGPGSNIAFAFNFVGQEGDDITIDSIFLEAADNLVPEPKAFALALLAAAGLFVFHHRRKRLR